MTKNQKYIYELLQKKGTLSNKYIAIQMIKDGHSKHVTQANGWTSSALKQLKSKGLVIHIRRATYRAATPVEIVKYL